MSRPRVAVNAAPKSCEGCKHCERGTLFELCLHAESAYFANGASDFHTTAHMRDERGGKCGPERKLFA